MNAQVTDTVRASREGHLFHEAWTARKAMQLLLPMDGLIGIAVEGLSEEDQSRASAGTVEIADLTVYYGQDANFCDADRVETLQFKYSPKRADQPFRASDAKKTIKKFAESYHNYRMNYGAAAVTKKLYFGLITNRPIFSPLQQAIDGIAKGRRLSGDAKTQAKQFETASSLSGRSLKEFASKCRINGLAGTLREINTDLWKILVDWSATSDALARARLGEMRTMVATKAGYEAQNQKVIRQVDVLDVLGLSEVEDLLPCPKNLPTIGQVVERKQLKEAASLVPTLTKPLIVHADAGIGKTVFLQSLSSLLSKHYEVIFFDCFGGGNYRSPEDGRHRPNRGLVHIANLLACRGLCDPILPGTRDTETLFTKFRKRLAQCVQTLATVSPNREIILFIDAIDNAAEYAEERGQPAFPTLLLESVFRSGPFPGVRVIASGRTHRIRKYISNLLYQDFELHAFTIDETKSYLSACMPDVTEIEIRVAQSRSEGNASILEHLVTSDRGLLDPSEINKPIAHDELLKERIKTALGEAIRQGYQEKEINAFLAGLSVLPPPVPLKEYAGALDMDIGAIRSFAADLAPLFDRTRQGMIFRNEPTETLVRENYGADTDALKVVAGNLLARQAKSVYAAQALPGLLQKLGDGKKLFNLAFDERFPSKITSTIGQRKIRYARLQAAVQHAADAGETNSLVRLLVELSTIATSEQRGAKYILDNPDLVFNSQDVDALRRLFETRTNWAGSRHARLTITSVLSGDFDDASRHFTKAFDRIRHDFENFSDDEHDRPRPEHIDHAAIPFFLLVLGERSKAIRFMQNWYPWYAFEISEDFFELTGQAIRRDPKLRRRLDAFLDDFTDEIGPLAGGLSFLPLSDRKQRELLVRLAKACKCATKDKAAKSFSSNQSHQLSDGLRKAATIATALGMTEEALSISLRTPHGRPDIWSMVDLHSEWNLFPFLFHVALCAAVKGTEVHERDILPSTLVPLAKGLSKSLTGNQFQKKLKEELQKRIEKERDLEKNERKISDGLKRDTDRFLNHRLIPFLELTRALASFLGAPLRQADTPFQELVRVWAKVRTRREVFHYKSQFNSFFQRFGTRIVMFALWARSDLKAASIRFLLKHLHEQNYLSPSTLIEVIAIVARRPRFDVIAGEQAVKARTLIELEDDVTTRSELFAELARAILPKNADDAAEYFRTGLNQLDAIGSDDYELTNELLCFASSIKGDELSQKDFHTLTNICELNMPYEEEKFPWGSFGTAMSRTSGLRGLAKLSRWHDRGKISLKYTLLPYLTALVRDGKIDPEDALALNRLANPAELWGCNTETFATTIHRKCFTHAKVLIRELIQQFEDNNPRYLPGSTVKKLAAIAEEDLGKRHSMTKYLSDSQRPSSHINRDLIKQRSQPLGFGPLPEVAQQKVPQAREIAAATNPLDEDSLYNAVSQLKVPKFSRAFEQEFFRRLRTRVRPANRSNYISLVARLEELDFYAKQNELAECKKAWASSSASLDALYKTLATPILEIHAEDLLDFGGLSTSQVKEVSDLTGVAMLRLTLDLTKYFSVSDWAVPASAWLGLASIICEYADEGQGQMALEKLLKSGPAKLTSTVLDGRWKPGLYPGSDLSVIASGFVWQLLGSPRATDRWRAAHSVRCLARLGRWEVIDALVRKLPSKSSTGFGAPELPFYYLHARLWLLIALSRIARDFPTEIAKHHKALLKIALEHYHPHVVIRHFAAQTVLNCINDGALTLSEEQLKELRTVDESPLPHRRDGERNYRIADLYKGRPKDVPDPGHKFTLDYDFDKYEVDALVNVFQQPGWVVRDLIIDEILKLDASVTSMHDKAGREIPYHRNRVGLTSSFHVYGQYLAWHALRFAGAHLLSQHPITENWDHGRPWSGWLSDKLLTRSDGLWLYDGMDRPPLQVKVNVLERGEEGRVLTGDRDKLMSLAGIVDRTVGRDLVVNGDWISPDGIDIHISSAFVNRRKGRMLAKCLLEEDDASFISLPTREYDDDEYEHFRIKMREYEPWIVSPLMEGGKLEQYDPLSTISVERRPRFVPGIVEHYSLKPGDPFQRSWLMSGNKVSATTDAWGFENPEESDYETGIRLVCRTKFLSRVLEWKRADLILLVKLRRYEAGGMFNQDNSRFSYTISVLRIKKDLKFEYFAGPVNQVRQSGSW